MKEFIDSHDFILMEAAVVERLRRGGELPLDPLLVHAPFIYSETGKAALQSIYEEYLEIAAEYGLPIVLCTPTWRANRERVDESGASKYLNQDAVRFVRELVLSKAHLNLDVKIGGILGCKNDCYLPEEALSERESEEFHRWQVESLAEAMPDFLLAVTLPEVNEALGLAKAMSASELPYVISFVIGRNERLLDGTALSQAIKRIDASVTNKPTGYMINCSYPDFLDLSNIDKDILARLIGFQANASSLSHSELDGAGEVKSEPLSDWVSSMCKIKNASQIKMLGGCCGTDGRYLEELAKTLSNQ